MIKLIIILICLMSLLLCGTPFIYAQDIEEPGDADLLIRDDLASLRPASAEVANSESPKMAINMPAEAPAGLAEEAKKPAMVLVNGRIVPSAEASAGQSELFQKMDLESRMAQAGQKQKEQAYTVSPQMSRPEPEIKPIQK